jgi:CelD/BcsL family acetyltransferase involved in cellulose biosynthesis
MASVRTRVLQGFDDPTFGPDQWDQLLGQGDSDIVYLTRHWQRAWWETLGDGDLLLIVAERDGRPVALAPLFADSMMVFFVGTGESDYLDFVGDISDPGVLDALLGTARDCVPDFVGFRFHDVLNHSRTGQLLEGSAGRLGLSFTEKGSLPAPEVDLASQGEKVRAAVNRSLRKRENYFRQRGPLAFHDFRRGADILPQLDEFFRQHVARWEVKQDPSRFLQPVQRAFIERLMQLAGETGWVRFRRLEWQGRPIAFEFGWCYHGTYYGGPWCFDVELARRSPGQVLLRQSLLTTLDEGARVYDFGPGDQPYKLQLASHVKYCHTWGLYATEKLSPEELRDLQE